MTKDENCSKHCAHCGKIFYRDKRNTWAYWAKAKFCSRTCSAREGVEKYKRDVPTLSDAFYRKVVKSGPNDCWGWSGVADKDGYPLLTFRKKLMRAARVAVIISGREMPDHFHACHDCGNKSCCNPRHIYAGTAKQNNADKKKHGTYVHGESVHFSKLTENDVRAIRSQSGTDKQVAEMYGVTPGNIWAIRAGKTWKGVT